MDDTNKKAISSTEELLVAIKQHVSGKKLKQVSSEAQQAIQSIYIKELEAAQETREALFSQVVRFRERLFSFLILLMASETFMLFAIVIIDSIGGIFHINDTTLQILVGATIAQISTMVIIIIKSAFPDSLNKIMGATPSSNKEENITPKT
jgi:hypothetical protein